MSIYNRLFSYGSAIFTFFLFSASSISSLVNMDMEYEKELLESRVQIEAISDSYKAQYKSLQPLPEKETVLSVKKLLKGKKTGPHDGIYEIKDGDQFIIAKVIHTKANREKEVQWFEDLSTNSQIIPLLNNIKKLSSQYKLPDLVRYIGLLSNVPLQQITNKGEIMLFEKAQGKSVANILPDILLDRDPHTVESFFSHLGETLGRFYNYGSKLEISLDHYNTPMRLIGLCDNDPNLENIFYDKDTKKVTFIDYSGLSYGDMLSTLCMSITQDIGNKTRGLMNSLVKAESNAKEDLKKIEETLEDIKNEKQVVFYNIKVGLSSFLGSMIDQFSYYPKEIEGSLNLVKLENPSTIESLINTIKANLIRDYAISLFSINSIFIEKSVNPGSNEFSDMLDEIKKEVKNRLVNLKEDLIYEINSMDKSEFPDSIKVNN